MDSSRAAWSDLPTEVHHRIIHNSSFTDARRLSMLSRHTRHLFIETYVHRLKVLMSSYDFCYDTVIPAMKFHGAVMNGPLLFALIGESYIGATDTSGLDFYVPKGTIDSFEKAILEKTPYKRIDIPRKFDGTELGIYEVGGDTGVNSIRLYTNSSQRRTFTIIESQDSIATTAIFLFPTTLGMTYLTWNGLVSAYPLMFLKGYGIVNHLSWSASKRALAWASKYAVRGYHTFNDFGGWNQNHHCGLSPYCGRTTRKLSDRSTMRLPLSHDISQVDCIDDGLAWQLASRAFCYGSTEITPSTFFDKVPGRILTSQGLLIGRIDT
ncbi:hypothetical protein D9611_007203 [Ephemerocybe angulata]|uniref:F-box domain-containing protein n=1 Tax=Ephemerocybe angulata TaxID=980116 RepID=A0A8H5EVX0_9AGAR|nr:hypothetical protein D9611_007203 [Tulosesus angulatus]